MSADTTPISPARFASAIKSLSTDTLRFKVFEISNSIAQLEYSNDQLKPFAQGRATILQSNEQQDHAVAAADGPAGEPDEDCIQAIEENERVIERMMERIALIKMEVEERGVDFVTFMGTPPERDGVLSHIYNAEVNSQPQGDQQTSRTRWEAGSSLSETSSPWTDGSIIAGTIRNGHVHINHEAGRPTERGQGEGGNTQGGSLSDEQLRAALERQVGNIDPNGDDEDNDDHGDGGLYI